MNIQKFLKKTSHSFIFVGSFALFAILNFLSYQVFTRFDLTEGNIYTLSDSSKNIAKTLPEEIEVKLFFSENLPAQVARSKQDIEDYLGEYVALSNGKIKLSYIDPLEDKEDERLAQYFGIPPLQLQVFKKDQRQTVKAYMGLAMVKEKMTDETELEGMEEEENPFAKYEKFESIPILTDTASFEYDFTSGLKKISSLEEKSVGFLTGHGEHQLSPSAQLRGLVNASERQDYDLREILGKNYQLQPVDLSKDETSLDSIDTLVIGGPKEVIPDDHIKEIQSFVENGGNLVLLIDQIDIARGMIPIPMEENFSNLLNNWGIKVSPALVQDASHTHASFSQGFMSFMLPYPYWSKVRNLSKDHSITSQIESFVIPWVSPLEVEEQEDVNVEILASTSSRYELAKTQVEVEVPKEGGEEGETEMVMQDQRIDLDPQQRFRIKKVDKDPLPLAVIAQKEGEGKVFVMGDSDFISFRFTRQFPENVLFFLNVIDAFTIGEDLISIRSKGVTDRPLKALTESEKNLIRWGNIVLLPLLVIIFGLMRRALRNAKKRKV